MNFLYTHILFYNKADKASCYVVVVVFAEAGSILVSPDGVMARWMATAIIGAHTH